jgi:hypothetical protein
MDLEKLPRRSLVLQRRYPLNIVDSLLLLYVMITCEANIGRYIVKMWGGYLLTQGTKQSIGINTDTQKRVEDENSRGLR